MESLTYLIIIRLVHIVTGVFWAGATIYLAWFIIPAVRATGPDGGKFMQQLGQTNKLPVIMTLSSILNVVSGILLLWELSAGFNTTWLLTKHGLFLSAGSLLAIFAFADGFFIIRPTVNRMNNLSDQISASGRPPVEEQMKQLNVFRERIASATNLSAYLLLGAVIGMSVVRYV